jgi:outer membrane receptor protein involved in Fe transport
VDGLGRQTSEVPLAVRDTARFWSRKSSGFLQDEWRPTDDLTVNLGLRFDEVRAVRDDSRLSPRASLVWAAAEGLQLHVGYARYFLPAPLESAGETPLDFVGTTAAPPSQRGDPPLPETDEYYDIGVQRAFDHLTLGIDAYWREARNLIVEGQFGPANLPRAFNFAQGRLRGVELTATFAQGPVSTWANLAVARAEGREVVSNQFYFTPAELGELARAFTSLPQDQTVTGSAGIAYRRSALQVSGDLVYGSGLPTTPAGGAPNSSHLSPYAQLNLAAVYRLASFNGRPLDLRVDILNVFDASYRLRDGRGLGDGEPLWGPRRGVFIGVEQTF